MFDRPHLLWLLALAPIAMVPGILAIRAGRRNWGAVSAALRGLCVVALVAMIAGLKIPGRESARSVALIAALDQSRSITPDQQQWMRDRVAALRAALGPNDQFGVIGFGRDARLIAPLENPHLPGGMRADADPGATNLAAALSAAMGLFPADADRRIVVLSDGNETEDSALAEVPALAEQGVRVFAAAPPPPKTERVALTDFRAPDAVRAEQRFAFGIDVESEAAVPIEAVLKLRRDGAALGGESIVLQPGLNRFELPYRLAQPGAYLMSAEVAVGQPRVVVNPRAEAAVTVIGAPRILIASATPADSLAAALKVRNDRVDLVSPRSLSERAPDYLPYQLVILDDVAPGSLTAGAQRALNRYVADLGGGLIATGNTLRDEQLKGSELEKALPVKFSPQPPPPAREPIAVYLCIDRSNSMSYDSRYPAVRDGERIRYAKQAAIALLRQLDDTDLAGVIAFDSQPYVLAHLQPLGDQRGELEKRIESLQPGGGTDFKDALEIAKREILQSQIPVRQVLLLTDGDTNRQYHDHDDLIAEFARQHIPVSTIRIGPDLANLRLLQDFAQATGGVFYRVQDIEKLPLLLVGLTRQAMKQRPHGATTIAAGAPSAILSGIAIREIPPIDFFASTTAKDGAQVALKISRGDESAPLLAAWQYGLGRAATFAADPDSLATLSWIRWNRYAEFWSQLVNWTMRQGDAGAFTLRVRSAAGGSIAVEAQKADSTPTPNLFCRIAGPGPATVDVAMTQTGLSGYRAEAGPLERGKYSATLMVKNADTERVISVRQFAAAGSLPADSAELRLRPANITLLRRLSEATGGAFDASPAAIAAHTGATVVARRSAQGWLIPLVIGLLLGEVFVRRRFLGD